MGEGFFGGFSANCAKVFGSISCTDLPRCFGIPSNLYTEYGEVKERRKRKGVSMAEEEKVETTEAADTKAAKKGKK